MSEKNWFVLQKCLHEKDLQEPIVKFPKTKGMQVSTIDVFRPSLNGLVVLDMLMEFTLVQL
jgi:hypothetical protein